MSEFEQNCKHLPRRYSLSSSEKATLGKSLLRYIQVSHYFKKPTVSTINENIRQELISKHKSEIEKKNLEEIIKSNNVNLLNDVNKQLRTCINEKVSIKNIERQKRWLNKLINETPPDSPKKTVERKVRSDGTKCSLNNKYETSDEFWNISSLDRSSHINSEKGFPVLNYQYNNINDTVLKWNPPKFTDKCDNKIFRRKLRVAKRSDEDCENKDKGESSDKEQTIPTVCELRSEKELNKRCQLEEKLYLRQYYEEIKSNCNLLEYIREKNDDDELGAWLEDAQREREECDDERGVLSSNEEDEARDLHTRNDYRRFDIIFDSNLFGYCDFEDSDRVIKSILKMRKDDNREDEDSGERRSVKDDRAKGDKDSTSDASGKQRSKGNFRSESPTKSERKGVVTRSDDKSNNNTGSEESGKVTHGLSHNSLINMLLKAGADIDEDEERIIKEEKDQIRKLRPPYSSIGHKASLLNVKREEKVPTTEEVKEYFEKKRKNRIEIRKKVLREEKEARDYSIKLLYDNPVMLQLYIQKMDNEIEAKRKMYEQEKSSRMNLSYRLKFMIERNAELIISNENMKREILMLENDYSHKVEYMDEYSNRLSSELTNLENMHKALINSLGMLSQWCVCEPEYLDPICTKEWEKSSISLIPGGRPSHALLLCKRICEFDKRLSDLYRSMYIKNYKNGLKILKRRSKMINLENVSS